jgi:hypothetical protein
MPERKDWKRLVRERVAKTGESYSIARMHLLKESQPPEPKSTLPTGRAPSFSAGAPGVILQIKITLREITPTIWRRVQVPADLLLSELAQVFIETMGWTNSHLHEFKVKGIRHGEPDPEGDDFDMGDLVDESTVSLRQVVESGATTFTFLYDFGDHWEHNVEIEKIDVEPLPGVEYPACIAGERACPPEDCGGAGGYENLLDAITDPEHEDHEQLMAWLGAPHDPGAFNVTRVNVALARLTRKRRRPRRAAISRAT